MRNQYNWEAIICARKSKKLTKAEMARQLKLPYSTYDSYEKGLRTPSSDVMFKIMNVFPEIELADFYKVGSVENKLISFLFNRAKEGEPILILFEKLNQLGKEEAFKRISELTRLPEYSVCSVLDTKPEPGIKAVENVKKGDEFTIQKDEK